MLVDDVASCAAAVERIMKEREVAVDLEGVSLGRAPGKISVLQVHFGDATTYIFDITVLKQDAFDAGGLRTLFESPGVQKVFYDARSDCDALYHNHNVSIHNAYDLQVLFHFVFAPGLERLIGLKKALGIYAKTSISAQQLKALEDIKAEGVRLFEPRFGGDYDLWERRPLAPSLVTYCAADVKHLLSMKALWGSSACDGPVVDATAYRIGQTIAQAEVIQSERSRLDFPTPPGLHCRLPDGILMVEVQLQPRRLGYIIGPGGSALQNTEGVSGASIFIRQHDSVALVVGRSTETQQAAYLLNRN